ncbi:hypothetical protein PAMA_021190 [Pampus argenteus]
MPIPIIRSLLSQKVHRSSHGMVLTSLQLSLKAAGVGFDPLFNKIYQLTLYSCPGFVFLISSIVTIVAIILIRVLDSGLAVGFKYQQVHAEEEAETSSYP